MKHYRYNPDEPCNLEYSFSQSDVPKKSFCLLTMNFRPLSITTKMCFFSKMLTKHQLTLFGSRGCLCSPLCFFTTSTMFCVLVKFSYVTPQSLLQTERNIKFQTGHYFVPHKKLLSITKGDQYPLPTPTPRDHPGHQKCYNNWKSIFARVIYQIW